MDDALLALHVAAGVAGLILGPLVLWAGVHASAYRWSVLGVSLTALGLVALDPADLWWLALLAALAYGLALLGGVASGRPGRGWTRALAHGWGGSYIALVTAALVVSVEGPAQVVAWALPTVAGVLSIERWVRERNEQRSMA